MSTSIALLLLYRLLSQFGSVFASLTNYLVPIVGLLLGNIFLQESLPQSLLVSTIIILTGLFMLRRA